MPETSGFQRALKAARENSREAKAAKASGDLLRRWPALEGSDVFVCPGAVDLLDIVQGRLPKRVLEAGGRGILCSIPVKDRKCGPMFASIHGSAAKTSTIVVTTGEQVWNIWLASDTEESLLCRILP